jgi:hypothetical protein
MLERWPVQKFDADFIVSLPDHPALATRLRSSCQMQRELFGEIIDITDRLCPSWTRAFAWQSQEP